jgi:hypothetical protein
MRWAAALFLLLLPGQAVADDRAIVLSHYHGLLAKSCPEKHLDLLSDSALRSFQGNFIDKVPHAKRLALADIANRDPRCAPNFRDARCVDASFLRATAKTGQLAAFVEMMCRLPVACKPGSLCNP